MAPRTSTSDRHTQKARVLVVRAHATADDNLSDVLTDAGFDTSATTSGIDALRRVADETPDVMIVEGAVDEIPGMELVARLRAGPWHNLPLVVVGHAGESGGAVEALAAGADDYVHPGYSSAELVARVQTRLAPPSSPNRLAHVERMAISESRLMDEAEREMRRAVASGRPGVLVALHLAEMPILRQRLGARAEHDVAATFAELFAVGALPLEEHSVRAGGGFLLLLPETSEAEADQRLRRLSQLVARTTFHIGGEQVQVTAAVGYAGFPSAASADELRAHAHRAMEEADLHLDLRPVLYTPEMFDDPAPPTRLAERLQPIWERLVGPLQMAFTLFLALSVPFTLYVLIWQLGVDLTVLTYPLVVTALVGTAALLWAESVMALRPTRPPAAPARAYPPATALIAAYLPNEAATIVETLSAFLRQDYPGGLQILLAYNSPQRLPVEDTLEELAAEYPQLQLLRVEGSTSKAQNINAGLAYVTGEFVGVFDADHHPAPGSFARAWRWLSNGSDVVQGHCVVRNGDASWVSRLVAVEFETIYGVSHPGRARLHGFGIFGGSNGYWRSDALRRIRMHRSMLTEDIDSSMRALLDGLKIVSDPGLISTELSPTTIGALWHQRMRWAQGWTQTAREHLRSMVRSTQLSRRQKIGSIFLLGWAQVTPWVTVQVIPIVAFTVWRHGLGHVDWLVPLLVALTVFTLSVGVAQAAFAYRLGDESIRRHGRWFWLYGLYVELWYGEFKNMIVRVSQIKEFVGDRQWRVTSRAVHQRDRSAQVEP